MSHAKGLTRIASMDIPQQIERFVRQHRVLTLATCVAEEPWCAHCFYVYMPEHQSFFFASDSTPNHIEHACPNQYVAGVRCATCA